MTVLLSALVLFAVVDHTPDSQLAKAEPPKAIQPKKEEDIPLKISRTFYEYNDACSIIKKSGKTLVVFVGGGKPKDVNLSPTTLVCYEETLPNIAEGSVLVMKQAEGELLCLRLHGKVTDDAVKVEVDRILSFKSVTKSSQQTPAIQYSPTWRNLVIPQTCPTGNCPYR